jgi:hypothetical protein
MGIEIGCVEGGVYNVDNDDYRSDEWMNRV